MKIAVISDTHDNLPNLQKAAGWIKDKKISRIIHCGDVCNAQTLEDGLSGFSGKIYLSRGNCDIGEFDEIPKLKVFDASGEIKGRGVKIAFCHFPKPAAELAESGEYDIVFYGHDHKPWLRSIRHGSGRETKLANPGNLAGIFYKATFATYDTKTGKLELHLLEKIKN